MAVPEPVLACWQSAVEAVPTDGYSEVQPALTVVQKAVRVDSEEFGLVVLAEPEAVPDDCFRAALVAEPRSAELPHRVGYFPAPEAAERCDYFPLPDGFPVAQAEVPFPERPDAVPGWVARPDDCFPEFPVAAHCDCSPRLDGFPAVPVGARFPVRLDDYFPECRAGVRCGCSPCLGGFLVVPVEARFLVRLDDYFPERRAEVRCGCSPRLDDFPAVCFPVGRVALRFPQEHQGGRLDFPLVLRRVDYFLGQQAVHRLTYHAVLVAIAVPVPAAPPASFSPAEARPV